VPFQMPLLASTLDGHGAVRLLILTSYPAPVLTILCLSLLVRLCQVWLLSRGKPKKLIFHLAELFSRTLSSPPHSTLRSGRSGALPLPTLTMSFLQTTILLVVVSAVPLVQALRPFFQLPKQLHTQSPVLLEVTMPAGWTQVMSSREQI